MTHKPDPQLRRRTDRAVAWLILAMSVIVCAVGVVAWVTSRRAIDKVERVQVEACHHIRTLQHQMNATLTTGERITVITCPKDGG